MNPGLFYSQYKKKLHKKSFEQNLVYVKRIINIFLSLIDIINTFLFLIDKQFENQNPKSAEKQRFHHIDRKLEIYINKFIILVLYINNILKI